MDVPIEDLLMLAVLLLAAASCLLAAVKPRVVWDLRLILVGWQYREVPEPSRLGLAWIRACGVIGLTLLGLVGVLRLLATFL